MVVQDAGMEAGVMEERPFITIDPGVQFGAPCLGRTPRLPAHVVAERWWAGLSLEEVLDSCQGENRREDVLVACWYMARHSTRTWRKRWEEWADANAYALWEGKYDEVPMPPQKEVQ